MLIKSEGRTEKVWESKGEEMYGTAIKETAVMEEWEQTKRGTDMQIKSERLEVWGS